MTYAVNAQTNANRAFERLLSAVQNIIPKEVSKTHQTATILTIRDKARNYTYSKIKRLTDWFICNIPRFLLRLYLIRSSGYNYSLAQQISHFVLYYLDANTSIVLLTIVTLLDIYSGMERDDKLHTALAGQENFH